MSRLHRNVLRLVPAIVVAVLSSLHAAQLLEAAEDAGSSTGSLTIGWAETEITPPDPVILTGLGHARVSEGVKDPLTATALAIDRLDLPGLSVGYHEHSGIEPVLPKVAVTEVGDGSGDRPGGFAAEAAGGGGLDILDGVAGALQIVAENRHAAMESWRISQS